eukprot:CAMPEP_0174757600 /NCGR_PEP_ID=MMETSP1094-20130205/107343_1 /TAXON_ID=156173 /ORGANISM="Chrysochromulina brevifilum, Strain UTEX LB 985" /LENGTH=99 /DNA_ID=CAMNT_0015963515 /DNA_START=191 /DNA_END=490 /DNA_ORIENTATION=+
MRRPEGGAHGECQATGSTSPRCGRAPRTCRLNQSISRSEPQDRLLLDVVAHLAPRIGMNEHIILPVPSGTHGAKPGDQRCDEAWHPRGTGQEEAVVWVA